jgi:hypothetical protein
MYRRTNIACTSVRPPCPTPLRPILTHVFPRLDELPSTVKALNDGWLATYQISTVVVREFLLTWYIYTHAYTQ